MRVRTALSGLTLAAVLALPGVAGAGESAIPPVPMGSGSSNECALAKSQFRSGVTTARHKKRQALRAARATWLISTADERATRRAALAAADTQGERTAAKRTFRRDAADERATRRHAKQHARAAYRSTVKSAGKELHRDLRACR